MPYCGYQAQLRPTASPLLIVNALLVQNVPPRSLMRASSVTDAGHIANLLTSQSIQAPLGFEHCPDVLMTKKESPPFPQPPTSNT